MHCEAASLKTLDELDLRQIANILKRVYPHYSLCQCARMAADFVPEAGCVCTICAPGTYPGCIRRRRAAQQQAA